MDKTLEYLEWALAIIDSYYQETGKIGVAEVIVWKAAKAHVKQAKAAPVIPACPYWRTGGTCENPDRPGKHGKCENCGV